MHFRSFPAFGVFVTVLSLGFDGCSQEKSDAYVCCVRGAARARILRSSCNMAGDVIEDVTTCTLDGGGGGMSPVTCTQFCLGIERCTGEMASACINSCQIHATVPVSRAAVDCTDALPSGPPCPGNADGPCWDQLGL